MEKRTRSLDTNSLLATLSETTRRSIEERCDRVSLTSGQTISDPERPIEDVYFPITAVLSMLSIMTDRSAVETGVVGHEGMAPLAAFHGVDRSAEQVMVQVPGDALRMPRAVFDEVLARSPELREALHRFSQALFTFAAQTSACNRKHSVVQRCARWLMVTHDRVPGDDFYLTHLFLAQMLGVRRSSVTIAAEALRAAGAIAYSRGKVHLLNRDLLTARSCDCYAIIRATYDRLLDKMPTRSPLADLTLSEGRMSLAHSGDERLQLTPPDGVVYDDTTAIAETMGVTDFSAALEALHVAQEELRAQVEALESVRDTMEAQHEQWRARFDGLADAFIETDQHDRIVEVNRAGEQLLGRPRHALLGKPFTALIADNRRELRDVLSRLHAGGDDARWTGTVGARDVEGAAARPVEVSVAVARAGGDESSTAMAVARRESGRFAGARWLLRRHASSPAQH